jgi:hypothetical protein
MRGRPAPDPAGEANPGNGAGRRGNGTGPRSAVQPRSGPRHAAPPRLALPAAGSAPPSPPAPPPARPPTPGGPDPDLPRRGRDSGPRDIRYTPTIAEPPARLRGDLFDGSSGIPFVGEAAGEPAFSGPAFGEVASPEDFLQGSPGYEFGPGTGPMRALSSIPRRAGNTWQAGGTWQAGVRPPGPGAGPAGPPPDARGPGMGTGLAGRIPFGPGTRTPRAVGPADDDDIDEDDGLTTSERLLKEIRTALRPRGWAIKVGVPILAMIPVGIAVVIIAGANNSNGSASQNPDTASLGFPPANFATADFTASAAQAGRGISQVVGPVAASGDDIVAVGDETGSQTAHTEFYVSQNAGRTWSLATIEGDPPAGHVPTHIAVGPNGWVAVGADSIWTSQNGTAWTLTSATGLPTQAGDTINVITRTANGFLAAGGNRGTPVVWTSANGMTWQRTTPKLTGATSIVSAAGTANAIVIASRTTVWRSTDGVNWTPVAVPRTAAKNTIAGVAQIASGFVAVRPGTTASQAITYTSATGQTWTRSATIMTGDGAALTIGHVTGATTGAAVTGSARGLRFAFISGNGVNWTGTESISTTGQETETDAALTAGNVVVTTGTAPITNARRAPVLNLIGTQGAARHIALAGTVRNQLAVAGLAASGGTQVAAGSADGFPAIWTSTDGGVTWTRSTSATLARAGVARLTGVAHGNAGWVAVGGVTADAAAHPVVVTSADGANWTAADTETAFAGANLSATAVAAGESGYVIAGHQGDTAVAWFSTGVTGWQRVALPDAAGATISAVAATGRGFAAVGTSGNRPVAWVSQNGTTWRATTVQLPAGATSAELSFVAANGNRVAAAGASVTGGQSKPFAVVSSDGGATWEDSEIVVSSGNATITALTAAGSGFTATGVTGSTPTSQNVVIWMLASGTTWTAATPSGKGLSGTGVHELNAITSAGNELTAAGFVITASSEQPTIWQSPVRG